MLQKQYQDASNLNNASLITFVIGIVLFIAGLVIANGQASIPLVILGIAILLVSYFIWIRVMFLLSMQYKLTTQEIEMLKPFISTILLSAIIGISFWFIIIFVNYHTIRTVLSRLSNINPFLPPKNKID